MPHAVLSQRAIIRLSGDDTLSFLQGLVSNDVLRLQEGGVVYAAMLTPQGKFLHDFFIYRWRGAIYLDVNKIHEPDLLIRLRMYRLRAKIEIETVTHKGVAAVWDEPSLKPEADLLAVRDPRYVPLGWRVLGDIDILASWCKAQGEAGDYEAMRIAHGIPDGEIDMIAGKSLLLEFGFEDLHGVDFNKGCYVGQEVTARSKHRGQVRKFLYQVKADAPLPPPGTPVVQDSTQVGELCSVAGNTGLAQLRTESADAVLYAKDVKITVTLPPWVTTREE